MSLITYPYLIHKLGHSQYGVIAYSQAIVGYLGLIINFGFTATATKDIALNRDNEQECYKIASNVFLCKALLCIISLSLYILAIVTIPWLKEYQLLHFVASIGLLGNWLFPDWFFQGVERMLFITYATLFSKILGVLSIFVLIEGPQHIIRVVWIYSLSNVLMGLLGFYFFCRIISFSILIKLDFQEVKNQFVKGFSYFGASIIANLKEYITIFIIGAWFNYQLVAIYDIARKIISVLIMPLSALARAVFPRAVISSDQVFNQKIEKILLALALIFCFAIWILPDMVWNKLILSNVDEFKNILYTLMWVLPMYAFTLTRGYLRLVARGKNHIFFRNIFVSVALYCVLLMSLKFMGYMSVYFACILIVVSLSCEAFLHYISSKRREHLS
ncbi:hypothetical protein A4G18_07960 [Pasteurellaceae bacterium Pebbles2]|nr:hypothetical protein [Pasteurellaceae bacterium Pebbles2]